MAAKESRVLALSLLQTPPPLAFTFKTIHRVDACSYELGSSQIGRRGTCVAEKQLVKLWAYNDLVDTGFDSKYLCSKASGLW
jgi:hypothetical protein